MSKLFKAAFKDAQPKIAALIVDRVTAEANKTMKEMAPLYTEALSKPDAVKLTDEGIEISLGNKVAQAREAGSAAWDIKKEMLAHATKFSKDGSPYVDVPFKHTTSGTKGTTMLPLGMKRAIDSKAAMQSSSKNAAQTTRMPMKTKGKLFTRVLRKEKKGGIRLVKQAVQHKRGRHDDLIRTKAAGKRGSVSYSTVRRISAKSKPGSWWHPGFKPAGILKKVLPKLKPEIQTILKASLAKVSGGKR